MSESDVEQGVDVDGAPLEAPDTALAEQKSDSFLAGQYPGMFRTGQSVQVW